MKPTERAFEILRQQAKKRPRKTGGGKPTPPTETPRLHAAACQAADANAPAGGEATAWLRFPL